MVSVKTNGLTTPQLCTGTVTLSVPGSTSAPLTIPVSLNVSNTALLNLSPAVVNVVAIPGSAAVQQTIAVTSTDAATSVNFNATAATNPPGLTWLSVAPNSGSTPLSLNVTVNPANLPPGIYTGSINVSSTAPNVPPQTIPVVLTVASGTVGISSSSLAFTQPVGGPAPGVQSLQITGIPTGATIGASTTLFNGSNWLNVTTTGSTVTVTPNGGQLAQGTYSGVITVFVPGASNSPLYVPVTYTVGGQALFTPSPTAVNFNYQVGGALPAAQPIQLTSGSGSISFSAVAALPPGSTGGVLFTTVSPSAGTTPGTLTVQLNQSAVSTLAPGTYNNVINLTSAGTPGTTQSFR